MKLAELALMSPSIETFDLYLENSETLTPINILNTEAQLDFREIISFSPNGKNKMNVVINE